MKLKERVVGFIIGMMALCLVMDVQTVHAEIASDQAFENATWEMIREQNIQSSGGVVQSICCTEDYIICIENASDYPQDLDIVYYFYKNHVDENGNEVEQYSLAKTISNMSYEHSNGMAYNPNTNEIAISLYTNIEGDENRGTIYLVDASTFDFKRKVNISSDYNILGIGYLEDRNQYVIQTDIFGNYSFKILDENFQIIEDLGEYADTAEGNNFQDLYADGDYIINFPLTLNLGIGDFIHMYSISRRTMVSASPLNWGFTNVTVDEPEGLCETEPGVFVAVVNVTLDDGTRNFRLYKTAVPYNFTITTAAKNGTITDSSAAVLRGDDYAIDYKASKDYRIDTVIVDGENVDIEQYTEGYTFKDVQSSHTIQVNYVEMTAFEKVKAFFGGDKEKETEKEQTEVKETSEKFKVKIPRGVIIGVAIFFVALAAFALYLRVLYVRRVRILKRRKAARERRRLKEEYEKLDPEEIEDRQMRDFYQIR